METAAATLLLSLDAVIVAVTDEAPRILCIDAGLDQPSLPTGLFNHEQHPTIERGLRHWVREQSGVELGYVEQLYTFGDRYRDPRERSGGARVVSVAYLTLLHEQALPAELTAHWRDWYEFLPWEDWREGRPAMIERRLRPALKRWSASNRERQQRVQSCFGSDKTPWDPERTLERYELLWEAGVVAEALRDGGGDVEKARDGPFQQPVREAGVEPCASAALEVSTGGQAGLDHTADGRHVGTSGHLRLEFGHDLAHVGDCRGAGRDQCGIDHAGDFVFAERLGHVTGNGVELGLFGRDQVIAAGLGKLLDRLPALFGHLVEHGQNGRVVQLRARVDLALLDLGRDEPQR